MLHRACACTGIQHSRGRSIAAMLTEPAVTAASAQLRLVASLGWGLSAASALAVAIVVVLSDGQVRPKKKSWRKMLGVEPVLAVEIGVACLSY